MDMVKICIVGFGVVGLLSLLATLVFCLRAKNS